MRAIVLTAAASYFIAAAFAPVFSQGAPATQGPANPAVKSMDQNNAAAPVAGANSFTMAEARSHIESKGYSNVTDLKKDGQGVWRGMAMMNGNKGPVTLDYQGNVN